jgi:hypothetical protein
VVKAELDARKKIDGLVVADLRVLKLLLDPDLLPEEVRNENVPSLDNGVEYLSRVNSHLCARSWASRLSVFKPLYAVSHFDLYPEPKGILSQDLSDYFFTQLSRPGSVSWGRSPPESVPLELSMEVKGPAAVKSISVRDVERMEQSDIEDNKLYQRTEDEIRMTETYIPRQDAPNLTYNKVNILRVPNSATAPVSGPVPSGRGLATYPPVHPEEKPKPSSQNRETRLREEAAWERSGSKKRRNQSRNRRNRSRGAGGRQMPDRDHDMNQNQANHRDQRYDREPYHPQDSRPYYSPRRDSRDYDRFSRESYDRSHNRSEDDYQRGRW